eukprot:m.291110 g.291110  ORF g.291110 m.291110 type:complete len:444 (-) comp16383_c0_seq6:313-1644(-)
MAFTRTIIFLLVIGIAFANPVPSEQQQEGRETIKERESDGKPTLMEAEAFNQDCKLIAKSFDWNFDETKKHMRNQLEFEKLVDMAFGIFNRTLDEKIFAGSVFSRTPGAPTRLYFKSADEKNCPKEVQRPLREFVDNTGLRVELHCGMQFSFFEQEDRVAKIDDILARKGFKHASSSIQPGDVILVSVERTRDTLYQASTPQDDNSGDYDTLADLVQKGYQDPIAKDLLSELGDTTGIFVSMVDNVGEPMEEDDHAYGGRQVRSDTSQCTSGFTVYRMSDGVTGVVTAAHCTNMHTIDAVAPEADFALYHKAQHYGDWGDVEWKTTAHVEPAEYYADVGERRDVNSRKTSFSNNDVVCLYSRMQSRRTCDRVYSTSTSQQGSKRLVAMDHRLATGGDSGGPWSTGTQASGIHKGGKLIWFKLRDTFSRVHHLDNCLGIRVRTK